MVLPQKIVIELSDADRRLLKRIAVALEGRENPEPDGEILLQETFPAVKMHDVVRHV